VTCNTIRKLAQKFEGGNDAELLSRFNAQAAPKLQWKLGQGQNS